MDNILNTVIQSVQQSEIAFSKYITANDTGATGGHQAGFHVHKRAWPLAFDRPGEKGTNKDKFVSIRWQNDFETASRFIYYGVGTRDEYRLTRFGRGFPFLSDDNIGDLLVLVKKSADYFEGYVLQSDEDIEGFFVALNISSADTNGLIPKQFEQSAEDVVLQCFEAYVKSVNEEFPSTFDLATNARSCYLAAHKITPQYIRKQPDREIINWLDAEFQLFKAFERDRYSQRIQAPFQSVEELIKVANTILNRRKSRAGKSLEHHLATIFDTYSIPYSTQSVTEENKKPDFLFPGADAYHNPAFKDEMLFMLAAKTTCKDRWRQILNEADRIKTKHLFTLQQGISQNQLQEMDKYHVQLVVPKAYLSSFPTTYRSRLLTLELFVQRVAQAMG